MCLGIPMRVVELLPPSRALVAGRGVRRVIDTTLVADLRPGDWVLVLIEGARERISAERAAEVDAVLDLVARAMGGAVTGGDEAGGNAGFTLPSTMNDDQLRALTGAA